MLFLLLLFIRLIKAQVPCASRNYGNGGTVCVCNTTYCDTIPQPERPNFNQYLLYTSNMAGLRFQQTIGTFQPSDSESDITIDSSIQFQTIIGFGGAFTDSVGINIKLLPTKMQETLLESYYSDKGIEYSFERVPIGGTDFSPRAYTYDDGPIDPKLKNFKLQPEDHKYKIPFIKRANKMANNTLFLFGSAWAAPKWMKTNHNYTGNGVIIKCFLQTWANYHLRFLSEYQKCGINFWGLTTGNEPFNAILPKSVLEVVGWPPKYLTRWIKKNLGPTIRNSAFSNISLMIFDDERIYLQKYVEKVFQDSNVQQYINGIALHWYTDTQIVASLLNQTHNLYPNKFILSTEASGGFNAPPNQRVLLGSWERGEDYSHDIIEDIQNWSIGWTDWNIVLNLQGGPNYVNNFVDSPIIINATSAEFYKQPMFYHLGHFSKFVPRNSRRVQTTLLNTNPEVVAFKRPDNGTVVVLLNRQNKSVLVNIIDESKRMVKLELTERSITTLLYWQN